MTSEELESVAKQLIEMKFLNPDEDMTQLIATSDSKIEQLKLTHEKISERMEYFLNAVGYQGIGLFRLKNPVDEKYSINGITERECIVCPWDGTYVTTTENIYITVTNLNLKDSVNSVAYSKVNPHFIREHRFYGGGKNRIEPPLLARVLDINPVIRKL